MAQIRQDYSLFPVKMASGKTIYYYQTYDNYGRRTSKKSTGKTNKTAANAWVKQLLKASPVLAGGDMLFSAFATDWWEWDRCSYVRMKLATSPKDRPGISPSTVKKYKEIMTAHILPTFKDTPLGEITVSQIERWMFSLQDKGLTNKTIVNVQGVLNIMLKEAYRKDLIIFNPMDKAVRFTGERKKRDLLTMEEAQKVLSPALWPNPIYYAGNLLAASTGMRSSEIRGLLVENYHGTYIDVRKAYTDKGGLYLTKTKERRLVPVPESVRAILDGVACQEGFLLSHDGGKTPVSGNRMENALRDALAHETVKISDVERTARGISFHGWRHWFNTVMRSAAIPDSKVMAVTGHKSKQMVDHYTSYRKEDFQDIINVQRTLWNSVTWINNMGN